MSSTNGYINNDILDCSDHKLLSMGKCVTDFKNNDGTPFVINTPLKCLQLSDLLNEILDGHKYSLYKIHIFDLSGNTHFGNKEVSTDTIKLLSIFVLNYLPNLKILNLSSTGFNKYELSQFSRLLISTKSDFHLVIRDCRFDLLQLARFMRSNLTHLKKKLPQTIDQYNICEILFEHDRAALKPFRLSQANIFLAKVIWMSREEIEDCDLTNTIHEPYVQAHKEFYLKYPEQN